MISHIIQSCFLISFVLSTSQSTVKLIIDTDGVYDDIRGLTIALTYPNVEVLAITTVHGGVTANQSAANVVRLLRAVGKESIPIFIGAQDSMIPKGKIEVWEELFGYDGIGGVPDANPKALPSDFKSAQKMHAVDAIIQFTRNTSDVVLVGLGPLTNIAMALQKDADLANRIRKVVIMGGNYLGIGNTQYNSTAEFNFLMDPEAAQIVLSSIHTTIVPWDTCFLKGPVYNEEVDYEESLHQNTNLSYFLSNITLKAREFNTIAQQIYAFVDDIAISIAIDPEILKKSVELYASVELEREAKTRGQVTIDWLGTKYDPIDQQFKAATNKNEANWLKQTFVTEYDVKKINQLLVEAVNPSIRKSNLLISKNSLFILA